MAARDWRARQDKGVCRDCGRQIEPKRLAAGNRCCHDCAKDRADDVAARRLRHKMAAMTPTTDPTSPTPPVQTTTPAEHVMQFFAYEHLPPHLAAVSKPFCDLARILVAEGEMPAGTAVQFPLPRNPQRTMALNKLLEAKDHAVRALLAVDVQWHPVTGAPVAK